MDRMMHHQYFIRLLDPCLI